MNDGEIVKPKNTNQEIQDVLDAAFAEGVIAGTLAMQQGMTAATKVFLEGVLKAMKDADGENHGIKD